MTTGTQLMLAVLSANDVGAWRSVDRTLLTGNELQMYDRINEYSVAYGRIPEPDTVRSWGFGNESSSRRAPSSERGGIAYLSDRLKDRKIQEQLGLELPQVMHELQNTRPREALIKLSEIARHCTPLLGSADSKTGAEAGAMLLQQFNQNRFLPNGSNGILSGWNTLDMLTRGLHKGDLVSIVGRPNVGKSYVMFQMLWHALRAGAKCTVISMEMSQMQVMTRLYAIDSGIDPNRISSGDLQSSTVDHVLMPTHNKFKDGEYQLSVMEGGMVSTVAGAVGLANRTSPDVLFVDAAYLLRTPGSKVQRHERLSEMIAEMKITALQMNIPIVLSFQFNRNMQGVTPVSATPDLGAIADTDSVGKDSSVVIGIRKPAQESNLRILDVMKNRDGGLGKFAINFSFTPQVDFAECDMPEESEEAQPRRRIRNSNVSGML